MDTQTAVIKLLADAVRPHDLVVDLVETRWGTDDEFFFSLSATLERKLWAEINTDRVQFRVLDGREVANVLEEGNDNVIAFHSRLGKSRNVWEMSSQCSPGEAIARAAEWLIEGAPCERSADTA